MTIPSRVVAQLGGHASRRELLALGCDDTFIKLSLGYRTIVPTRRGWYATPGTPPPVLRALRAGGRLACVSALAFLHGEDVPEDDPVHVAVPYGASRLGSGVVAHWSRRAVAGTRLVVAYEEAEFQAATCRARAAGQARALLT